MQRKVRHVMQDLVNQKPREIVNDQPGHLRKLGVVPNFFVINWVPKKIDRDEQRINFELQIVSWKQIIVVGGIKQRMHSSFFEQKETIQIVQVEVSFELKLYLQQKPIGVPKH